MTHKREWDAFTRATSNKKFPIQLSSNLQKDKSGLFRDWLAAGKSFNEYLAYEVVMSF